ncbi:MAG: helix-turn-helix transcriptional regulator [Coriobacteriaceae bacterium]|nr:helix-turn-helix transcriptional regulator [Coriobacteriaceae bacterium]
MSDSAIWSYRVGDSVVAVRDAGPCRAFELEPQVGERASSMRVYRVVPGIAAPFYEFGSPRCGAFNEAATVREVLRYANMSKRMLEVNVCREGSFRVLARDGRAITSITEGDVSLAITDISDGERQPVDAAQEGWRIDLPTGKYRGFGLIVDLEAALSGSQGFTGAIGVDLERMVDSYHLDSREFLIKADLRVKRIVDSVYRYHDSGDPSLLRLSALELLAALALRSGQQEYADGAQCSIEIARLVREARNFAVDHLDRRYTIEEMCRMFNMSPTVFKTAFRELYGQPYAQYLTQQRMERAEQMLARGELVLSTSLATGYESPGKFSAAFKRRFGETPSAYRCRMQG